MLICDLVLCPRTGKPMACRLPLYVPISFNRLILSCTSRRASFSIFIVDNSAVRSMTVAFFNAPTLAQGWMWNLAMIFCETLGPMPKKLSSERYRALDSRCARCACCGGRRCCTYFDERRLCETETVDKHLETVSASPWPSNCTLTMAPTVLRQLLAWC